MKRPRLTRTADGPAPKPETLRRPPDPTSGEEKQPREERIEWALVRLLDAVAYENRHDEPRVP